MVALFLLTTGINGLQDVLVAVADVNQWLELGLALGLKQPTLVGITSNHKIEMLTKWLGQVDGCQPSWNALVEALKSRIVQCYTIADEIKHSHQY